ncbi:MAG: DUF4924 family protein [Muribaculaceae bacterium]|nr:DUF4924 family protein [Muribaculaceae bacterium]
MIIASQKRKENIAEYLLYMWQIEDLIRANGLDADKIKANVISRFGGMDERQLKEMGEWYESLIDMMRREEVAEKGHLQMHRNIINDLARLNNEVLADPDPKFEDYRKEFYATLPFIVELRAKSGEEKAGEIETCFNALYGVLLLRLQGKGITPETQKAVTQISRFVALLAKYWHLDEEDKLFAPKDEDGIPGTK